MARFLFLVLTLEGLMRGGAVRAGPLASEPPAKQLSEACGEALRARIKPVPLQDQAPDLAAAIRAGRERLLEFTQQHRGDDLDPRYWGNAFESIHNLSFQYEWRTAAEAETGLRQAWQVLARQAADQPALVAAMSLKVANSFIQSWVARDPVVAARIIDETTRQFVPKADPEARRTWSFFRSSMDANLLRAIDTLPLAQRAALYPQREAALQKELADESIPLDLRSMLVSEWGRHYYSTGNAAKSMALLDDWEKRHGANLTRIEFHVTHFFAARHAALPARTQEIFDRTKAGWEAGRIQGDASWYNLMLNAPPLH